MTSSSTSLAIGIDLGGTDIKGGLVAPDGAIVHQTLISTEAERGVDHVIDRIIHLARQLADQAADRGVELVGLGLGSPGTLSRSRGMVSAPPNLPGWRDVPIVERVAAATGLRVELDNDANYASWAEFRCGAGRGADSMVMLTLGTGIGSGIILDGKIVRGSHENAGELGHTIVQVDGRRCKCGQRGCLEAYASATQTAARMLEAIRAGEPSVLSPKAGAGGPIDAGMVAAAAADGDEVAGRIWRDTCRYLAAGCINIHHSLDPARIVLAGGMSAAGDQLLRPVVAEFDEMASNMLGGRPEIRLAQLGNDAGFVGAGLGVFERC